MSDNTQFRTTLSAEDFERFTDALDAPAGPTPAALENARRYREKIADGSLVVEDDAEDFGCWARKAFAAQGVEVAEGAEDPDAAANAEGYDPDTVLAQHLLHDCGTITPFVEATLSAEEVDRVRAELRQMNAEAKEVLEAAGAPGLHPRVAAIKAGTAIDWDTDEDRLISDCGRYEITRDQAYDFATLHIDGVMESEDVSVPTLKRMAQEHKNRD